MSYCVYSLKVITPTKVVYKVGYSGNLLGRVKSLASIEAKRSEVRGLGLTIPKILILNKVTFETKKEAMTHERTILRRYRYFKYKGPAILANGNSELLLLSPKL